MGLTKEMQKRGIKNLWDLTELDAEWVNAATREEIKEFVQEHNDVWLGRINCYKKDEGVPYLVKYEGQKIYNFEYEFMVPCCDDLLMKLIKERDAAEYTGANDDCKRLSEIIGRINKLGGKHFVWV
ncbi:MAG: hypothetical protein VST71_06710 [Nitrospirota bacterium]|nr:hypothetical protein [Nitrospirota bacterium]